MSNTIRSIVIDVLDQIIEGNASHVDTMRFVESGLTVARGVL